MDGEFFTILASGLLFIVAAVGYLAWQRKKNADDGSAAVPARKSPGAKKDSARKEAAKKDEGSKEKKSLLAALGVGAEKKPAKGESAGPTAAEKKELESLIAANHIDDAARLAMRLHLWDKAAQLYLKADQLANAAHCAKRAGKFEMAAEFYEKAKDLESAIRMWEKSGNPQRARALAGEKHGEERDSDEDIIKISKELQAEIDAAVEKKDHMRAAELYEQGGDKEHAAEQFAAFAQTARRPEMYAEKIQMLSPRVAYNMLRIATKGRPPSDKSAELYRRVAMLQHHFDNHDAAIKTLEKLLKAVPDDEEAAQMLEEIEGARSSRPDGEPAMELPEHDVSDDEPPLPVRGAVDDDDALSVPGLTVPLVSNPTPKARPAKSAPRAQPVSGGGPAITELVAMIAGQECDLGNIEVYYRLGLACLDAGKRDEARKAFQAVDDASPGYRDTEKRLRDLD